MFLGSRARLVGKADVTSICEPIVYDPQQLTTVEASTACYGDRFTFFFFFYFYLVTEVLNTATGPR
jgi:hypothetical protein